MLTVDLMELLLSISTFGRNCHNALSSRQGHWHFVAIHNKYSGNNQKSEWCYRAGMSI